MSLNVNFTILILSHYRHVLFSSVSSGNWKHKDTARIELVNKSLRNDFASSAYVNHVVFDVVLDGFSGISALDLDLLFVQFLSKALAQV